MSGPGADHSSPGPGVIVLIAGLVAVMSLAIVGTFTASRWALETIPLLLGSLFHG